MDEVTRAFTDRAEITEVAVLDRADRDGRVRRVAYVVPAATVSPIRARRTAEAVALTLREPSTAPLTVAVVSGIPRAADGTPDAAALATLPVAGTVGAPVRPAPAPSDARRHLADLIELPSRWATTSAPVSPTSAPDSPPPDFLPPVGPPAIADAPALVTHPDDPTTLPEALLRTAERWPNRGLRVVEEDGTRLLPYPDLLVAARRTLTGLRAAGLTVGDPVILHMPSLLDHCVALWACLIGGLHAVAVAQAPGYTDRNATLDKLEHAWRGLDGPPVLSGDGTVAALASYADRHGLDGMRVLDVADCRDHPPAAELHRPKPGDVAMLQLSSGSTSRSKIIPMTHRGIVGYAHAARQVGRMRPGDEVLNWLPLDHVAGVVTMHIGPVVLGCGTTNVTTALVLADPLLWLDLLERHVIQHSWSPNFGYKLVSEALRTRPERRWDLRHVRSLVNAGEQCTVPVVRRFLADMRGFGIEPDTMLLAWGMAETSTVASYQPADDSAVQYVEVAADGIRVTLRDALGPGVTGFLSMGAPTPGTQLRITGPDGTTALPERHIGRLQLRSDRVTPGYLSNDEANRAAFPDGDWFDTGDLAYLTDGRLTITGRGKEVIIVNGVHYFCHDIEDVVGDVDGVAASFVAAVGAPDTEGTEQIVVLFVAEGDPDAALLTRIRRHLADRLQIATARLVPVPRDRFEKTTSGKIQRSSMRTRLLDGGYVAGERRADVLESGPDTVPDCLYRPDWSPRVMPADPPPGPVLVVTDRLGLAVALHDVLPDVVIVDEPAADDGSGPGRPAGDPSTLRDALAVPGRVPALVVFAPSYLPTPDPDDASAVDAAVEACGTGTLRLLRTLADAGWTGTVLTVSQGLYRIRGDESGCYPAALAASLGETFGVEHPEIRTWHLDLPGRHLPTDAAVLAAATGWRHRESVVAWRDVPLVRTLRRVEADDVARERTGPATADGPVVPAGTHWLVTGGLGGVSRAVLGRLATELDLHLLVVGRTPADQVSAGVADLAGGTGRVRYATADVTDGPALWAAVDAAERWWRAPLDGVLHLAGDYRQAPLTEIDPRRWRAEAAAKVDGSVQVARLLRHRPGSRLVAFSSLLALVPVVGTGGYAAGNAFLEALCAHLGADRPVQCVSWGMWRGVGMSADRAGVEQATRRHLRTLSATEGLALARVAVRLAPGQLFAGVDPDAARVRHLVRPVRPLEAVAAPAPDPVDAVGVSAPDPVDAFGTPALVAPEDPPAPESLPDPAPPGIPEHRPMPAGPPTTVAPVAPRPVVPPPAAAPLAAPVPVAPGPRPAGTGTPGRDPLTVARTVREVLRQALPAGFEERTAFHDVGLDSVRLLRLHTLLQQALDARFPQTALFTHGTPTALVAYLVDLLAGSASHTASAAGARVAGDGRIAIVGMALRFPGADTAAGYWRNLLAGQVDVRRFDRAELLAAGWPAALVDDETFVPVSGALADIESFDAEAFGIAPREAALTDPQQRLFLEVCQEALEHAGYAGTPRRVGVFAGSGMHLYSLRSYLLEQLSGTDPVDHLTALQVTIGNQADFLATRVAYRLGLTGPAMSVQTACSTSLVAVHLAARSLLAGESDLALAGAAAVHVPRVAGYRHAEGSILSRTGVCRSFDADADGTVGGNGVAAVLLKRLDDALADGDTVHAVILGSAVNNDGAAKTGYTAPTADGHAGVIRDALATAGVPAASIGYLETHGTGTRVGDPIEMAALRTVFADRDTPLPLGAVKANIGHLDTAAGMAGLIKATMAVRDGRIPPVANLRRPNPELGLADGPFELPTAVRPWPLPGPRRAGVSSLGVGGTNAHVILEEPPAAPAADSVPPAPVNLAPDAHLAPAVDHTPAVPAPAADPASGAPTVVPLTAQTPDALAALAERTADRLATDPPRPEDVLVTLGAGRQRRRHRLVTWAAGPGEAATALRNRPAEAGESGGFVTGSVPDGGPGPVVFACTGQGVNLRAAAAGLLAYDPAREVLESCAARYRQDWGTDLLAALRGAAHEWTTATVQPALFALQVAQARLLESVGVRPDVVIGQSAGEYAALCLAGALSVEDGLHLAAVRGELMQRGTPPGAALAVLADEAELAPLLRRAPEIDLTVTNGPRRHVVAGPPSAVRRFGRRLDEAGLRHRPLPIDRAFHSALLDPVLDDLTAHAATLDWRPLRIPLVTGLGGARLAPGTRPDAGHVRRQTRERSDFGAGVAGLVADGCTTFVELGPEALLTMLGRQWPQTRWIPVRRGRAEREAEVTAALAELFCRGVEVDWAALAPTGRRVPLPTYPFQRTRHWVSVPRPTPPVPSDHPVAGGPAMSPAATPASDPTALVLRRVRELTAAQLGADVDRVPEETPFFDLGADSLLMINLLRELETTFGIRVPMRELFEELDSPSRLTAAIVERAAPERLAALGAPAADVPPTSVDFPAAGHTASAVPATVGVAPAVPATVDAAATTPGSVPAVPGTPVAPAVVPPVPPLPAVPTVVPPDSGPAPLGIVPPSGGPVPLNAVPPAVPGLPLAGVPLTGDPATNELLRGQLALIGQFTDLMARQLSALAAVPSPSATASSVPAIPAGTSAPAATTVPGLAGPVVAGVPGPATPTATGAPQPATPAAVTPGAAGAAPTSTSALSTATEPAQVGPRPIRVGAGLGGGRLDPRQQAHFADLVRRYTERTPTSKALAQRHRRRLADTRAVVGFRRATKEMLYPLAARRARGAYLEDVDGNNYVDITMGFGALLFGHEPEFLTRAIAEHLDGGLRLGPRGPETGEAAELLCDLTGMDRVAFAATGTEANSAAFRLARAFTGRPLVVMFAGAYHGHIDPVLGRGVPDGDSWRTVPISAGIPDSATADVMVLPYDDPRSLAAIERAAGRIAAVVVEPVQSRYPDRQPAEFLRALRAACDRHGMVLLFDEMLTGLRPHVRGAQGVFGVYADLATYGKVLGGGYPIGAVAGRADIMDWVDGGFWQYGDDSAPPQDTTFFGGTYIQHPLSMVAARAVLTELRQRGPALQDGLNRRTERLAAAVNAFCAAEDFPLRVHRFGSMFRFASEVNLDLLFHHLVLAGVHVWEWRNFFLSDAHTDADADRIVDAVRSCLLDLRAGGFLPGAAPRSTTGPVPAPPPPWVPTSPPATPSVPAPVAGAPAAPVAVVPSATVAVPRPDAEGHATPATGGTRSGRVDVSLYFFGDYPQADVQDRYDAVLDAATFADTHGLYAVWLPERHFDSFGGIFPNPSVLAAAVAARTSRVRVNAGCVVLPLHDPIRVAEEWSVVDNLSRGRVGIGCASGWHARDFVLAPQTYGRHREAMYESLDQFRQLWRGEAVTRTAGNGEPVEVRLFPAPVQPMPPLFTAVVGNPDSYRRAAAAGLGVITNLMSQDVAQLARNIALYRATRTEHGLDPDAGRVVLLLHTYLGADGDRAREEAFGPFCDYLRSSLALFGQVTNSLGFSIDLESTTPEDLDYLLRRAYDRYTADRALIGSPEEARPLVERLTGLGVDEIGCFVDFGLSPNRMLAGLPGVDRLRMLLRGPAEPAADATAVPAATDPAAAPGSDKTAATATTGHPAGASTADATALTEAQREIWFAERVLPGRPTYTESQVVRLDGPLDVAALRAALTLVVRRHPALRSTVGEVDGEPRLVAQPPGPVDLPVHDAAGQDVATLAERLADEETRHVFDLAAGPLFAPRLVRVVDEVHLLVLRMHHLVIDTLSAQVLAREVAAGYRAALAGRPAELPAPPPWPIPTDEPSPELVDAQLAYWRDRLGSGRPGIGLPTDRPRPATPSGTGAVAGLVLDADLTRAVREVGRRYRATPFMVLLAGFATVLTGDGRQPDVLLGTPVAHRPAAAQDAVGLFVATLPLLLSVDSDATFGDVVRAARAALLDAHDHGDVPAGRVARALGVDPEPGRHPLFDVVIEYDNQPAFAFDLPGVRTTLLDVAVRRAPFDLTLFVTDLGDTLRCQLNYATELFDPGTARRVLDRLAAVLRTGTDQPDEPLTVPPVDGDRLEPGTGPSSGDRPDLDAGPRGEDPVPAGANGHRRPAAPTGASTTDLPWQDGGPPAAGADAPLPALLRPDRATVFDPDGRLTGPELSRRAASVTAALRATGVGPGDLVGVHLPRSADAVAAMLGVLGAGAAYVPLAPEQPTARLADIVDQGALRAVVSRSTLPPLPGAAATLHLDRLTVDDPGDHGGGHPVTVGLDDPAYVLFTSGSTGRPKGCVIPHRAISNTVAWYTRDLDITAHDRLSWFCSPGFDASCIEVWPALRGGATLHVVPDDVRLDPERLRDWLVDTAITVAFFPTPVGELLLDLDWSDGPRPALRHLVVGGDRLRRGAPPEASFTLTNVYGPTEATVVSTWVHLDGSAPADELPSIGQPVPGTWIRVLDDDGRPTPVGVPGEAYLGGRQLGRGYLGLPEETAARFLHHPEYGPVFRTGDVLRWRPDGQLEFLRRADAQVQIRGFRVEPGEAEHHLRRLDGVRDAAVRGWRDPEGGHYLAGYVVPDRAGVDPADLARRLTAHLPDYLVPTAWTLLPELPTTDSGKIDRAALPEPDRTAVAWAGDGTPPTDDLEHRLHDLWCAELGLPALGVETTFFALGGTSLTAMRLLNRVRAETGGSIEVLDFLREPTVRGMARRLREAWPESVDADRPGRIRGTL
ncbi:non-ribosomal peptide synthetase/type I polyketide synthase [Micromonospora pallida]|uniref:non-ribosomal peptide synthetase/type I polyketide synthase n=1 Tax=Micromonospora pallida TaxID=145854 RepID=UPI001FE16D3F|nr:MupA/Atu3671 family FMN-dependent luciferase-like monooxygenase [Micromonospora pallida]